MTTTYALHPALFARAWLNVRKNAAQSEAYENFVLIEPHALGVWVVSVADNVTMASWCPHDEAHIDNHPPFGAMPIAEPFLIGDGRNRVTALLKDQWAQWKKDPLGAGDEHRITLSFTNEQGAQLALPGIERRLVRIATPTEHVDTVVADLPIPPWATLMRSIGKGSRDGMLLPPEAFDAMAAVERGRPPVFTFGGGSAALVTFVPTLGNLPVTFARVTVGKRDEAEDAEIAAMNQQVWNTMTGQYDDDVPVDVVEDDDTGHVVELEGVGSVAGSMAVATASSVLEALGISQEPAPAN